MAKKTHNCILSSGQIAQINAALMSGNRVEVVPADADHPTLYVPTRKKLEFPNENMEST